VIRFPLLHTRAALIAYGLPALGSESSAINETVSARPSADFALIVSSYASAQSEETESVRIKQIKQYVAVGKDALMCCMRRRFRYESRQNLGNT